MLACDLEVLHQEMHDLSMLALDLKVLHQEMQDLSMLEGVASGDARPVNACM